MPNKDPHDSGRIDRELTHRGKALVGYFIGATTDGIVFGIKNKELGNVHLTLFWKDGKIRSHITDETKPEGPSRVPWGQQFTPETFVKNVERIVGKMVKSEPYHPLRRAWVLREYLRRKALEIGDPSIDRVSIPIEFYKQLEDPKSWTRLPIRSLVGKGRIALIEEDKDLRWVIPIDKKKLVSIGVKQQMMLQNLVAREYGFERYWNYVKPRMKIGQTPRHREPSGSLRGAPGSIEA